MNFQLSGSAQVFFGALIISFAPILAHLTHEPPSIVTFYRVAFASLLLAAICWQQQGFAKNKLSVGHLVILVGGMVFSLDLTLWHSSISLIGPGLSTLIVNLQVIIMAVVGIALFKEPPRASLLFAVPIALVGLSLITGIGWTTVNAQILLGVSLAFLAALAYSAFMVILRIAKTNYQLRQPTTELFFVCVGASIGAAIAGGITGSSFSIHSQSDLFVLLAYAGICQVGGWLMITKGSERTPLSYMGLILLCQPGMSYLWDVLFFHKSPLPTELLGMTLLLSGIAFGILPSRSKPKEISQHV